MYWQRSGKTNPVTIWNKTGQMSGVRTDAALFQVGDLKWIVVSFTRDSIDHSFDLDHEGVFLNARTGRAVFEAWGRPAMTAE